jgi:hypothetical protein
VAPFDTLRADIAAYIPTDDQILEVLATVGPVLPAALDIAPALVWC